MNNVQQDPLFTIYPTTHKNFKNKCYIKCVTLDCTQKVIN